MVSPTSSLHSSNDSDGPCQVLSPIDPLFHPQRPTRRALTTSLDSVIQGVAAFLRPSSPFPMATVHPRTPSPNFLVIVTPPRAISPAPLAAASPAAQAASFASAPLHAEEEPDYRQLMHQINMDAPILSAGERFLLEANSPLNQIKNRYSSPLPTNRGLVKVAHGTCYINANKFDIDANKIEDIIITQGPLGEPILEGMPVRDTLPEFWLMLFEQKVANLICLTNYTEFKDGIVIEKTYPYWNPSLATARPAAPQINQILFEGQFEGIALRVRLSQLPQIVLTDPLVSTQAVICQQFAIECQNSIQIVKHWMLRDWPDHRACSPPLLLQMIRHLSQDSPGRLTVHCSAGIGRSGTFTTLYLFFQKYLCNGTLPSQHDISHMIYLLRHYRPDSVATWQQLKLIFDVRKLLASEQ